MWICHLCHSDLSQYSCGFAVTFCVFFTSVLQRCPDIPVDLLLTLCVFVTSVIQICHHIYRNLSKDVKNIKIFHDIHADL